VVDAAADARRYMGHQMKNHRFHFTLDSTMFVVVIAAGLAVSAVMELAAMLPAVEHGVASIGASTTTAIASVRHAAAPYARRLSYRPLPSKTRA